MSNPLRSVQLLGLAALFALTAGSATSRAAEPDPAVQKLFNKLLAAVQANDRDAFVADATDAIKQGVTQPIMDGISKQLGSRLKNGYQARMALT